MICFNHQFRQIMNCGEFSRMKVFFSSLVMLFAAILVLQGCTEKVADQKTNDVDSTTNSTLDTVSYIVPLASAGLQKADSVVVDAWLDSVPDPTHQVAINVEKEAVFSLVLVDQNSLLLRVRIYNGGVLVSTGVQFLDLKSFGKVIPLLAVDGGASTISLLVHDTVDLLEKFKALSFTGCSVDSVRTMEYRKGCNVAFSDSGKTELGVHFVDSLGKNIEEKIRVTVIAGIPSAKISCMRLRDNSWGDCDPKDLVAGSKVKLIAQASDSNGSFADGKIVKYMWDLAGAKKMDSTSKADSMVFELPKGSDNRELIAHLTVTDDDGYTYTDSLMLIIKNHPPSISWKFSNPAIIYDTVYLFVDKIYDEDSNQVDSVGVQLQGQDKEIKYKVPAKIAYVEKTPYTHSYTMRAWDKSGAESIDTVKIDFKGDVWYPSTKDVTPFVKYVFNPTIALNDGETIKTCKWSLNGGDFNAVGNSCDTVIVFPKLFVDDYPLIWSVTTSKNREIKDTIHVKIDMFSLYDVPLDFGDRKELYRIFRYGEQVWMDENLRLPWTQGNESTNCEEIQGDVVYGACGSFFDWSTAMNGAASSSANPSGVRGVCPIGWHIPSDVEWNQLYQTIKKYHEADEQKPCFVETESHDTVLDFKCAFGEFWDAGRHMHFGGFFDESGSLLEMGQRSKFWTTTLDETEGTKHYPWTRSIMNNDYIRWIKLPDCLDQENPKSTYELLRECSDKNNPKQKLNVRCVAD